MRGISRLIHARLHPGAIETWLFMITAVSAADG
jgi:hypothetical protein